MALQMSRRAIIQNGRLASIVDKGPYVQSHHFISHSNLPRPQRWNSNRNLWWNATFRMRLRRGEPNSESAGAVDRFAQPFHCELDVLRLQLGASSRSRFGSALSQSAGNIPLPAFGGRALCELLADERIVWRRSLIEYLCLMLNIGSYSRAFNFSGNKKRNHSNRTSCAARHENEKSFIGGTLSRPHFPSIGHLCFSRVSSHRRHSFLRLQLQLNENTGTLQFCPACLYRHGPASVIR